MKYLFQILLTLFFVISVSACGDECQLDTDCPLFQACSANKCVPYQDKKNQDASVKQDAAQDAMVSQDAAQDAVIDAMVDSVVDAS